MSGVHILLAHIVRISDQEESRATLLDGFQHPGQLPSKNKEKKEQRFTTGTVFGHCGDGRDTGGFNMLYRTTNKLQCVTVHPQSDL